MELLDASGVPSDGPPAAPQATCVSQPPGPPLEFDGVYDACFDFVWAALRSLGVPVSSLDDATQDVFIVVHRRLVEFEGRSSLKTWVYGIALGVARNHRRRERRKGGLEPLGDELSTEGAPGPLEALARTEALTLVERALEGLDDEKREAFVLTEFEQLTAPEIAALLGVNLNTVYSRVRAARAEFERQLTRLQPRAR